MFRLNKVDKYAEYREIKTEEEAKQFQKNNYGHYCEQYNKKKEIMLNYEYRMSELSYIMEGYLGDLYTQINNYMRASGRDKDRLNVLIDRINELIMFAPQIEENLVVYRGVSKNTISSIMNQIKEYDGNYMEKAFMSTSLRLETVMKEFPSYECILKIYVFKGALALGVDCIRDRKEEEMLFPEQQWLKYIGKKRNIKTAKTIYEFELINYRLNLSSD